MRINRLLCSSFMFLFFFINLNLQAQHNDELQFGSSSSELTHGICTFNPTKSEVFTGMNGQTARRFLIGTSNPLSGGMNIYGGEISFVLKVDGTKQNYFTGKFSGDETMNDGERILLVVEGKEVGCRHGSNEEYFIEGSTIKRSPNTFYFRTAPIPRILTDGKTEVTVRIRSTGRFYAYGTPWTYSTYQREMTEKTLGIYKIFSHTDPGFALPESELSGTAPSYAAANSNSATNLTVFKSTLISNANAYYSGILNGSDYIATDGNNYFNPIEALGYAYFVPEVTSVYQNPAVITKIYKLIDNLAINNYNGIQTGAGAWGGAFGRPGYAVAMLYSKLDQAKLNEVINLGGGAGRTRRSQWCQIFKASFDAGAGTRKTITNQEMENDGSVYGASLALFKLDSITYATYPAIGLHMALESCGLEEFTGVATNLNTTSPKLGIPANSNKGPGYYYITKKGTSHEPGWVSTDCYGDLGHQFMQMYTMSKLHLGGIGETRFLERGIIHAKSQSGMTYSSVGDDGLKDILAEGFTCWRNTYDPGKRFYTNPYVAALTNNDTLIGYVKQMIQDGRFVPPASNDFRMFKNLFYFELLKALENNTAASTRLPSSPDQSNYIFSDEGNGIVTIKNGSERLFINMYYRDYADNKLVKIHHLTPGYNRMIECRPLNNEFVSNGTTTRDGTVENATDGTPPDNPESAYKGQVEKLPLYSTDRALKDYYLVRYGNYLIAMNTTSGSEKTIQFPSEFVGKSALEFSSKSTKNLPVSEILPPLTTRVYYVADFSTTPGLIVDTTSNPVSVSKNPLTERVAELNVFVSTASTISKISVTPVVNHYNYNLFNEFVQKLTAANYFSVYAKASQVQIDKALSDLNTAYSNLLGNVYKFSKNNLRDGAYLIKKNGSPLYLTNKKTSNLPVFESINDDRSIQIWNFQQDGERYKIANKYDGRYLSETACFGVNAYNISWNSMNIYDNGTNFAIQNGGSAGSNYWRILSTLIKTDDTGSSDGTPFSYPFQLIPYFTAKLDSVINLANSCISPISPQNISDSGLLGTYPIASYSNFISVLNSTIAAHDTLSTEVNSNALATLLNNALTSFKKSMVYEKNMLPDGKYYIKAGTNYYTAPFGFNPLNSSDSIQQWQITKKYTAYTIQNVKTGLFWDQNANALKTLTQINAEGNTNRFVLLFNGSKYSINKQASGTGNQYLNTNVTLGLGYELSTFPDPMNYFFEIRSINATAVDEIGMNGINCFAFKNKLIVQGVNPGSFVSVYDYTGRLFKTYTLEEKSENVNLTSGIYLVMIRQSNLNYRFKVIAN